MRHHQHSEWLNLADYQLHLRQLTPVQPDSAYPVLMLPLKTAGFFTMKKAVV